MGEDHSVGLVACEGRVERADREDGRGAAEGLRDHKAGR